MDMPMGAHKGKPIEALPTPYLLWVCSQDAIRHSRWSLIEEVVRVLGVRFSEPGKLLDELRVSEAPPARQETAEQQAERKAERVEKLRQLEKRRMDERLARREAWRAARDQADMKRMAERLRERVAARNKGG